MAHINKINVDNSIYLIEPTLYITPTLTTNSSNYTATLNDFTLITGIVIQASFDTTNPASATLNLNNGNNIAIQYDGNAITAGQIKPDHIYNLLYDGSNWQVIGDVITGLNQYGILYANTSYSYTSTSAGDNGKVLIGQTSSAAPIWYDGLILSSTSSNDTVIYNAEFNGSVSIAGATTIEDTLTVNDATILQDTLSVADATTLSDTLSVTGATTLSDTLSVNGTTTLNDSVGICIDPQSSIALTIYGSIEIVNVNNNSIQNAAYIDLDTTTISGSPTINIYPNTTNTGSLGLGGNSPKRWRYLYLGDADAYGDIYTPIYWNDGVPTQTTPIQMIAFTFDSTHSSSIELRHDAITDNTSVIEIVVTSGFSYLESEITWSVTTASGNTPASLTLSATTNIPNSGSITGYIQIAHTANLTITPYIAPTSPSEPE